MIYAWLMRQLPLIGLSVALLVAGWAAGAWLMEKGRAELRPVIERLQSELESERAARIRNEEALNGYQKELDSLRNRPRNTSPVRLCVTPSVRETTTTAGSLDGAAAPTGDSAGQTGSDLVAGPDIGPALRGLAYGCDAENAKLRALQGWARSVAQ